MMHKEDNSTISLMMLLDLLIITINLIKKVSILLRINLRMVLTNYLVSKTYGLKIKEILQLEFKIFRTQVAPSNNL